MGFRALYGGSALLFVWLAACTAPGEDTASAPEAADTGAVGGGEDTGAAAGGEWPEWGAWQNALSVERERGWSWELDEDFALEGLTVPTPFVFGGHYYMVVTRLTDWGRLHLLVSDDGLDWEETDTVFDASSFGGLCGDELVDAAVLQLDDGLRLVVEGILLSSWSRSFCAFRSQDGRNWTPEDEPVWEGEGASVPEALRVGDEAWRLYYLGGLPTRGGGEERDEELGLRALECGAEGPCGDERLLGGLPPEGADPWPVYEEGGGVRLFFTYTLVDEGSKGEGGDAVVRLAAARSVDGLDFEWSGGFLDGLGEATLPREVALMDPALLRLPDGRLLLYFTRIERDEEGEYSAAALGRAWAVD